MIDLDELERLYRKATPGPHQAWCERDRMWNVQDSRGDVCFGCDPSGVPECAGMSRTDAELWAYLRNHGAALVAEIEALRELEKAIRLDGAWTSHSLPISNALRSVERAREKTT